METVLLCIKRSNLSDSELKKGQEETEGDPHGGRLS